MAFLDKLKNVLAKNADKVDTAIDKAGDLVDKKTQGKYAQHVNKVQGAAKKAVDDNANAQNPLTPAPPPPPAPPTPPQQQPPTAPPIS
jgi:MT0933-like antitoxin protein